MGGRGPTGANDFDQHVHYQIKDPKSGVLNPQEWWDKRKDNSDDDTPGPTKMHFGGDGHSKFSAILTAFLNMFNHFNDYGAPRGPESSNPGGSGPGSGGSSSGSRGAGSGPGGSGPGNTGSQSGPKSGPGSERSRPGSEKSNYRHSNQDREWYRNTHDWFRRARDEEFRHTHEESRRQEQNERSRSSSRFFASRPRDARKSTLGSWAYPLRASIRYAASHVSPLVLDLNGDGIKLLPYTQGVFFDIDGDGFAERVGWVTPEEGQLARDRYGYLV